MSADAKSRVLANAERKRSGAAGLHRDRRTRRVRTRQAQKARAFKEAL